MFPTVVTQIEVTVGANIFKDQGSEVLPATGSFKAVPHEYTKEASMALWAAYVTGRPLLLRGEPGTGKSQIARAAAHCLRAPLVTCVIDSRTEPQDLRYQYDAVARLADAQALRDSNERGGLSQQNYIIPGPLWWAFNWQTAKQQSDAARVFTSPPEIPVFEPAADDTNQQQYSPDHGCVLLLDEIDKADSDVPNGLLESLGNTGFQVPYIDKPVICGNKPPLVIITTNEERELPAAFVRRCLVLQLDLPKDHAVLKQWLQDRALVHKYACEDSIVARAADLLISDRQRATAAGFTPPGQAEFLDMLSALSKMAPADTQKQEEYLVWVSRFALKKQPDDQNTPEP